MSGTSAATMRRAAVTGAALIAALLLTISACTPAPLPWNVVIVTFDTTRADYLAAYGN